MKRIYGYRCTICGKEYPFGPELMTCPVCGEKGILDVVFDYGEVKKTLNRESLAKDRDNSMWRYRALMPLRGSGSRCADAGGPPRSCCCWRGWRRA